MPPSSPLAKAYDRRRARIAADASAPALDPGEIAAKLAMKGRAGAAALAADTDRQDDIAVRRLNEVARLSDEGMPVKTIAATMGVGVRYVVELRAQLGIGRRR